MKTMKDYCNLYLKCDVLLLANVVEKFRSNSLRNYGLWPSHYFRNYGLWPSHYFYTPALSWEAVIYMTKVELELITDAGTYLFFKKVLRFRVCYIYSLWFIFYSFRDSSLYFWYSETISNYLKPYVSKQESKHIIYLDTNNL